MRLRAAALLVLAGWAVHELRYLVVPDAHSAAAHSYLALAPALLAVLLAIAVAASLPSLGVRRARSGGAPPRASVIAGALLAIHVVQETLERALAGGGPLDLGWLVVVPACAVAGAGVAWALRRAAALLEDAGPRVRPQRPTAPLPFALGSIRLASLVATAPRRRPTGRGPPLLG